MLKKNLRSEKGSITLFVLLAMLFFLIVIFGMFMTSSNKNRVQVSELDKIKKEYGESVNNIDQIYADALKATEKTIDDLKAGDRVYYDTGDTSVGNEGVIECIVLYDKAYNDENGTNYGVQMISADVIYKDNKVDEVILGVEGDLNASIEEYNNALKTLYDEAQKYLNPEYVTSSRCVGSNPDDPDWDATTNQDGTSINEAGYYTKEVANEQNEYQSAMEITGWYNNVFKNEDEQYNTDWTQMNKITDVDIKKASSEYWLASRYITSGPNLTPLNIRSIGASGSLVFSFLCFVSPYGNSSAYSQPNGFRPIFMLKPEVKITEGDGVNTPYTLAP